MSENKQQSFEIDQSTTTGIPHRCSECGQADCGHSTTTSDVIGSGGERAKPRRERTTEIPAELAEFAANYEVLGLIGEGGMSAVYQARHRALNKPMAIKMLHSHLVRDVVQRKRFEQEAHALFLLEHPNIVKLRDFGSTMNGKPYLIMDFLEGKSLAEVLKNEGPMPVQRALRMFLQICDALEHAHGKSIIHRDIKPSNIVLVVDEHGQDSVRIVDFGIAKFGQDEINPGLTQTGDVFGSPLYMSPEQCLGHKLDHRSDVYALGCVMYETLSGHAPLVGDSALATIHKHTSEMPQPLQVPNCEAKLRQRLDEIIFKTLEKEPDKRYQSLKALKEDLLELFADTGYRKNAGYYVRYARANRKAINAVKKHPIRFASALAAVIAIVSYAAYCVIDSAESLLKPPAPLSARLDWNWLTLPVEEPPADFTDKLRLANFIVEDTQTRMGPKDLHAQSLRKKLADRFIHYGMWEPALIHLCKLRDGYNHYDVGLADNEVLIGDVYAQRKEWKKAAEAYYKAYKLFEAIIPRGDTGHYDAQLKLAWAIVRSGNPVDGKVVLETARRRLQNSPMSLHYERAVLATAIAECDIAMEQTIQNQQDRMRLLDEAISNYQIAVQSWGKYSIHDQGVSEIRTGDVYLLKGNLNEAANAYANGLRHKDVFNADELAAIDRNYARILWRCGRLLEAVTKDEEAKQLELVARSARKEKNTQQLKSNVNWF